MPLPLRVMAARAVLVTWQPVQAQYLGPVLETNVAMTKEDLDIIH